MGTSAEPWAIRGWPISALPTRARSLFSAAATSGVALFLESTLLDTSLTFFLTQSFRTKSDLAAREVWPLEIKSEKAQLGLSTAQRQVHRGLLSNPAGAILLWFSPNKTLLYFTLYPAQIFFFNLFTLEVRTLRQIEGKILAAGPRTSQFMFDGSHSSLLSWVGLPLPKDPWLRKEGPPGEVSPSSCFTSSVKSTGQQKTPFSLFTSQANLVLRFIRGDCRPKINAHLHQFQLIGSAIQAGSSNKISLVSHTGKVYGEAWVQHH